MHHYAVVRHAQGFRIDVQDMVSHPAFIINSRPFRPTIGVLLITSRRKLVCVEAKTDVIHSCNKRTSL